MENYELNVGYKKLSSFIDSQFSEKIYKKISNRFIQLEENLLEKTYEGVSQYGFSNDFSVRQIDIKIMLENAENDFNTSMSVLKNEIDNIFVSFYVGLSKTMAEDFDENEKRRYLGLYIEYAKENLNSLYNKINDSFDFFDELDRYFKNHSGSDDFCDEMHSFLKTEKEKLLNNYMESVKYIIKTCKTKANSDIETHILPHLNKKTQEKDKNAPVTKQFKDGTVTSQYLSVDISMFKYDKELLSAITSLSHAIVFMDLFRDKKRNEILKEKYIETINTCKTSEDFKNLDELLEKLSSIGGIANIFYSTVSQFIKAKITIYSENEKQKQEVAVEEKETTVNNVVNVQEPINEPQNVEEKKEEQQKTNEKNVNFYEVVNQFAKEIESITNKPIDFYKKQELISRLRNFWSIKTKDIEQVSEIMLNSIAENYQIQNPTFKDVSNLLMDQFSNYIEINMQKDHANNVFDNFVERILKDNNLDWSVEDSLSAVASEYKKNFNLYMNIQIRELQRETIEKANKYFGIVYPDNNQETLEEDKGHKR